MGKFIADNFAALYLYVVAFIFYVWYMKTEKRATWSRTIIAAILWPVAGVLAIMYSSDLH